VVSAGSKRREPQATIRSADLSTRPCQLCQLWTEQGYSQCKSHRAARAELTCVRSGHKERAVPGRGIDTSSTVVVVVVACFAARHREWHF
jgi:hypothetical protein